MAATQIKTDINTLYHTRWLTRWEETTDIKHTRIMQPKPETRIRNKMTRRTLNLTFQIITGHSLLRGHLAKWQGGPTQCRRCDTGDETPKHLWDECPTLHYDQWAHRIQHQYKHDHTHDMYLQFFRQHKLINLDED